MCYYSYFCVTSAGTISASVRIHGQRAAILSGKKVTVEINFIQGHSQEHKGSYYSVGYEYCDENGTWYIGYIKGIYQTIEEARSQLGGKVEIYIDGKGNSIPVGDEPAIKFSLVGAIIFSTVFVLYIFFCIIVIIKYKKWLKKMEPIWEEKRKQNEAKKLEERTVLIKIEKLIKSYGKRKVLDVENLYFEENGVVGLIGPNGAGKTTLLLALSGKIRVGKESSFCVFDTKTYNNIGNLVRVKYYSDEMIFFSNRLDKIIEEHSFFYSDFDANKCLNLLDIFAIDATKRYSALSKGMKSQFIVCLALANNCPIILLDEPTAFMDKESRALFGELIKKEKQARDKLIFISTHMADELSDVIDEAVVIRDGRVTTHSKQGNGIDINAIDIDRQRELMEKIYDKK